MIDDAQTIKKWLSEKNREIIMKYLYNDIGYAIPIKEIILITERVLSDYNQFVRILSFLSLTKS